MEKGYHRNRQNQYGETTLRKLTAMNTNVVQMENNPLTQELRQTQVRLSRVENSLRALCFLTLAFSVLGLLIGNPPRATAQNCSAMRQESHNSINVTKRLGQTAVNQPTGRAIGGFRQDS